MTTASVMKELILEDTSQFIVTYNFSYGDKTPKSAAGRIFAVLWIVVGITICSLFTATLTATITETSVKKGSLSGRKVRQIVTTVFMFSLRSSSCCLIIHLFFISLSIF